MAEYTKAINVNGNLPVLFNNRGVCKYKLEIYSDAIEDYEKALKFDADYVPAYFNKGNCHLAIAEYDDALVAYDKTLELQSNYKKVYVNRSKVYFHLEDYTACINDIEQALSLGVKDRDKRYLEMGNAYFELGKYEEAIQNYTKALEYQSEFYKAIVYRGQCYLRLNKFKEAEVYLNHCIRLNGSSGEGYY